MYRELIKPLFKGIGSSDFRQSKKCEKSFINGDSLQSHLYPPSLCLLSRLLVVSLMCILQCQIQQSMQCSLRQIRCLTCMDNLVAQLILRVVMDTRKLRQCFQPHQVAVIVNQPVKQILCRLDTCNRLLNRPLRYQNLA